MIAPADKRLPPAIFLMGPTAAGKTAAAVELVQQLPLDIISVDSALVYEGFDIGAARPSDEVLAAAPHRMINFVDPVDAYSAGRFRDDARREMDAITAAGKVPLLVGGTMLYYRALLGGLADLPDANPTIRAALDREADKEGWPALHQRLQAIDPQAAARIEPADSQRIQRALEVYELTGKPLSELQQTQATELLPYRVLKIAVAPADRSVLHQRIEQRFMQMLQDGLLAEVQSLTARSDLHAGLPAIRAVGYRQVWQYLHDEIDHAQMVHDGVVATRRLAKRQLTWLRGDADVHWFDSTQPEHLAEIRTMVNQFLDSV